MRFAEAFSKVTAAIFGKQTLSTAQGAQSAVSGAAGATDDYADAVANAKKKQDKFLAGLDEITTLSKQVGQYTRGEIFYVIAQKGNWCQLESGNWMCAGKYLKKV